MKRKIIISILVFLFCLMIFLLVRDYLLPIDSFFSNWVRGVWKQDLLWFYRPLTEFGDVYILTVFVLGTTWYLYKRDQKKIIPFLVLMGTSALLVVFFKNMFMRPRPDIMGFFSFDGYSFPSGHSVMSSAFYLYIASLLIEKGTTKYKYVFALFPIMLLISIGFSRIYLGAHYVSDVLTGFILGSLLLNIVLLWQEKRKRE